MTNFPRWRTLLIFCCWTVSRVQALTKSDLYPFGSIRDQHLNSDVDDVSSLEVQLTIPVVFYGTSYETIFVNDNGLLSFLTEVPSFFNAQFPLSYPIIAPLYTDVDTRGTGRVYYRETQAADLLERATSDIRRHFAGAGSFQAKSIFIATWDAVGAFEKKTGLVNTFQVVIASNGEDSYVIFLYPESGVQWIQGQGKNPNLADARAQAGFMPGDGRLFTLRGSGTDQTKNFDRMSNIRQPGLWLFHVGQTGGGPSGNVLPADLMEGSVDDRPQTCASAQVPCPPTALCLERSQGFCCQCKEEFYGNGRSCIEKDKPHRMNGKVNGVLNEVSLENVDLHAYIVTNDGRTYTAIRRIPVSVGYDVQALFTLGGVIGWLFALPRSGAANGFTVTGGHFNRSTEVDFPGTGHHVLIQEEFLGPDVFNYMRVNVQLRGSLPSIPSDKKIEVDDSEEVFTRTKPGQLRSSSNKAYRLEGNTLEVPFTVDQTINYVDHCPSEDVQEQQHQQSEEVVVKAPASYKLKLARNFVTYDQAEEIVRFASTSKISPMNSEDPCKEGRQQCGAHSQCLAEGDSFRCVCDRGYEHLFQQDEDAREESTCVDVNECLIGKDNCHVHAECVNLPGGFNCRCQPGYTGDGRHCQRTQTCSDLSCDLNAECLEEGAVPSCRCNTGFQGDGYVCSQQDNDDCRKIDFCDAHADCLYSPSTRGYHCRCQVGYQGDGLVCLQNEPCDRANDCSPDARCYFDEVTDSHRCLCNPGYAGDGYTCTPQDVTGHSCNVQNNCHPWAQCIYSAEREQYQCKCQAGYVGDGLRCNKDEAVTCKDVNVCSLFGRCELDSRTQKHACVCNQGYEGNGIVCDPVDECNTVENCDDNAQCVYDSVGQRYRCQCNTGYTGNGKTCTPEGGASCHIVDLCHSQAQCVYDSVDLRYRCQCLPGYEGDGTTCTPKVVSCNVVNNCHLYAECSYDAGSQGHRCRCREGYEGDGHQCRLAASCHDDPFLCDVHADCVQGSNPGHRCQCKDGYTGDGLVCSVSPQQSGDFLLFAHGMSLLRMPFNPTKNNKGRLLLMEPLQTAVGVDVDCLKGNIYWTDVSNRAIRRASYDGSSAEIVFDHELVSPEGIAVDWASRNLYWTDSTKDTVEVLRLETLDHKVLVKEGLVNPRGIALHAGLGKLYWSDWDRANPKIEASNLDGSERSVFIAENLGLPNMLTVDYERNALCWTDAGLHRLECINLNGQQRRLIYTPASYPFGITVAGGYLYWTDWDTQFIQRVDRNGGNAEPIEVPLGGNGKLYGLTTVPSQCPRVRNPCAAQNGGCRHLCLPNGRGGRTCACPDEEDPETCNAV